ncbi:MAG: hypothetical protein MUC87_10155 [Bacteroidia bacterium]|jgi:hypothetical protein|nr:hypothetical protein [Bacteroidia bacterium]
MEESAENTQTGKSKEAVIYKIASALLLLILLSLPVCVLYYNGGASFEKPGWKSYFDGSWQKKVALNAGAESGAAYKLLGIQKQLDFTLYRKIHAQHIVYGKNEQFYNLYELKTYYGLRFPEYDSIADQVYKLSVICDSLDKKGVKLLFVMAPGKSLIYPEYMPEALNNPVRSANIIEVYQQLLKKSNIPVIDCIDWFGKMKKENHQPLFPPYGLHWSYYAECMVMDSTVKRIEKLTGKNLYNPIYYGVKPRPETRSRDGEVLSVGEILYPPAQPFLLTSPDSIGFSHNEGEESVPVLGIGDSYYTNFLFTGLSASVFSGGEHWYYFNSIRPSRTNASEVWELNLREELESKRAIVLLFNHSDMYNNMKSFVNEVYLLYSDSARYEKEVITANRIRAEVKLIRNDSKLLGELIKSSVNQKLPLDTLLEREALKRLAEKNGK